MNDLTFAVKTIKVKQGMVIYDLTQTKQQALQLQELLETIEVDDETVKSAKKLLANINKRVKALEDRRKEIKRELLEPYYEFETEVKEIVGIVNEANDLVKSQVHDLESKERDQKEKVIRDIWDQRIMQYPFDFVRFDDFIRPQHLNKTTSMKKIEDEMVEFLERILKDTQIISKMDDPKGVMAWYLINLDLQTTLEDYQAHKERADKIVPTQDDDLVIEETLDIRIFGKKDIQLVRNYLEEMEIEHREL